MEDLSHLCGDVGTTLIGGESMAAGNTINHPVTNINAAPGSMPVNRPLQNPSNNMDDPGLEIPAEGNYSTSVKKGG